MAASCLAPAPEPELVERGDLSARPWTQRVPAPLANIPCKIQVQGVGGVDLEKDYLPGVVRCENGGADIESLRAQAIAARSVAYYAIKTKGSICNSQSCQVYSCGKSPDEEARRAVRETSGVYLTYNGLLTYGFYVSGSSSVGPPSCTGSESWVTYNEGKTGTDVEQTRLGGRNSPGSALYGQNRGCFSQWGSRCLERERDYDFIELLQFYYGADIGIAQAEGECIEALEPEDDEGGYLTFDSSLPAFTAGNQATTGGPGIGGGVTGVSVSESGVATVFDGIDSEPGGLPDGYGGLRAGNGISSCRVAPEAPLPWLLLALVGVVRRGRSKPSFA